MVNLTLKHVDISEQEISAFVNQQMVELEPHINTKIPMEITLSESRNGYQVSLVAEHAEGKIHTVGTSADLFGAIINAKEGLLEYCVEVEAEVNPQHRDQKIDHILKTKSYYLH